MIGLPLRPRRGQFTACPKRTSDCCTCVSATRAQVGLDIDQVAYFNPQEVS